MKRWVWATMAFLFALASAAPVAFINSGSIWQTADASLQVGTYTLNVGLTGLAAVGRRKSA